ncbi:MAG: uracil-DNA glycosylase [Clostridiales bacterium]|nr:uracil-DNA glycosylase [Clostridiales bacterium]
MDNMDALREQCFSCQSCPLAATRTKVVFGVGPVPSDIVFVGEGPGQQEDLSGEPFVGAAGKLLDDMLSIIDLGRHNCYICNIVKCRPPQNRDPKPEEQDACIGYLYEQLKLLQPKIVVCLGRIAAMRLIRPDFRITREHGQWTQKDGSWYSAIYHPSALLRDTAKRPDAFSDLLLLRKKARELGCL